MQNNNQAQYATMNLKTIPNTRRTFYNNKHNYMDTSDIPGTKSRYIQKPIHQRQVFYNRNNDIQKSTCPIIIPKTVNKPDRQLQIDDISGTRTKINQFVTKRHTNPLNPIYQLPNVKQYIQPDKPKFIKDNLQIDDIQGTRIQQTFPIKLQRQGKYIVKNNENLLENKKKHLTKNNNFMDVTDINQKKQPQQRSTNPLEPIYKISSSQQHPQSTIGPIIGSKTTIQKQRNPPTNFNLCVYDIQGATSQQRYKYAMRKTQEMAQAKPGSFKRGISTNRKTNPLEPNYVYLGVSEQKPTPPNMRPKSAAQRLDAFLGK